MRLKGIMLHNQNRITDRIKAIHALKAVMLCGIIFLAGCGQTPAVPKVVTQSSLVIDTEGHLTAHIVDVFDKEYYDLSGLEEMARGELEQFRNAHQGAETSVELQRVEMVEGTENEVVVTYTFDSAATYSDYTGNKLFYGTAAEAAGAGYDFIQMKQVLNDTAGGDSIDSGKLMEDPMQLKHVILLAEGTRVYAPAKVAFISENAEMTEDGSVNTAGVLSDKYPVVIVLDR